LENCSQDAVLEVINEISFVFQSVKSKSGRYFSTSTDNPEYVSGAPAPDFVGFDSSTKSKSGRQRWSGFFGNNKVNMLIIKIINK